MKSSVSVVAVVATLGAVLAVAQQMPDPPEPEPENPEGIEALLATPVDLVSFTAEHEAVLQEQLTSPLPPLAAVALPESVDLGGDGHESMSLLEHAAAATREAPVMIGGPGQTLQEYATEVKNAIGLFPAFNVFEKGQIIPITVDGVEQANPTAPIQHCDRPALLGVVGSGSAQCNPYSYIGRLSGSKPGIEWVFIARRYNFTTKTDKVFKDVAVIGHDPKTGATAFFQHLAWTGDATQVPSPLDDTSAFWLSPTDTANINCNGCHSADPFIHSPYVDQVVIDVGSGHKDFAVPSDPKGPYNFIGNKSGEAFHAWPAPEYFAPVNNQCTRCHRIPTRLSFVRDSAGKSFVQGGSLTAMYKQYWQSHWMPLRGRALISRYISDSDWNQIYGPSVTQLIHCEAAPDSAACNKTSKNPFHP